MIVIVVDFLCKEKDEIEYDQYVDNISMEVGEYVKCVFIFVDLQKFVFDC